MGSNSRPSVDLSLFGPFLNRTSARGRYAIDTSFAGGRDGEEYQNATLVGAPGAADVPGWEREGESAIASPPADAVAKLMPGPEPWPTSTLAEEARGVF